MGGGRMLALLFQFTAALNNKAFDHRSATGKLNVLRLAIKTSDISNVAKPFPIARQWAMRVTAEFFQQGECCTCTAGAGLGFIPLFWNFRGFGAQAWTAYFQVHGPD